MNKYIINLRTRLSAKDVTFIYACALVDVAIVAAAVSLILFFV